MLSVLLLAVLAWHKAPPPQPPRPATPADAISALRADLIGLIERDEPGAQNPCGRARALLSAARDAPGHTARRLRGRLHAQLAPALRLGGPDCLVDVAAELVPQLPDAEKRAMIGELARLYEQGLPGWARHRAVLPAIAPHLTAEEARRLLSAVPAGKVDPCVRTIVLAHLASLGRVAPAEAFAVMRETRERHCLHREDLAVLRFADPSTLRALYPKEMALLDQPPAAFARQHVEALALLAPYLEPQRRRTLLPAAFRAMRTAYVLTPGGRHDWGDLPPEFHFQIAMAQLAPFLEGDLVDGAMRAIPPSWPPETRGYAAASLAASLAPPLRRPRLEALLAAIPAPGRGKGAALARLELAADLPPEAVQGALDVAIQDDLLPSTRATTVAKALGALPHASQPGYAARVRADVAASESADVRISTAALVLDTLAGRR